MNYEVEYIDSKTQYYQARNVTKLEEVYNILRKEAGLLILRYNIN